MSNHLAVATVTAGLSQILAEAISVVSGATVTFVRPDGQVPQLGVNLFLFQVSPNAAWRNEDLPSRTSSGRLIRRPQAALDLHYLLTFYGNDTNLEPQRLLGGVVRRLHAQPMLDRERIRRTTSNAAFNFLAQSDLEEQIELVRFTPLELSLEELSKLWSVFFQRPYILSLAYQATVVLIEGEEAAPKPLPVRARNLYVRPFNLPVIDEIQADSGSGQPILAGTTLLIQGRNLRGEITRVRIGELVVTPASGDIADREIRLALTSFPSSPPLSSPPEPWLAAGVHGLQVIHDIEMGSPPVPHTGFESNVAAFVLQPQISSVSVSDPSVDDDQTRSANIQLTLSPAVGADQRMALLLNEFGAPPERPARAYRFEVDTGDLPVVTTNLIVPVTGMVAGTYLVRLEVDGADSPLGTDGGGTFTTPQVTIP